MRKPNGCKPLMVRVPTADIKIATEELYFHSMASQDGLLSPRSYKILNAQARLGFAHGVSVFGRIETNESHFHKIYE